MSWEEFALGPTKLLRVRVFRRHASVRFPPRVDFIPNSYLAFRLFVSNAIVTLFRRGNTPRHGEQKTRRGQKKCKGRECVAGTSGARKAIVR